MRRNPLSKRHKAVGRTRKKLGTKELSRTDLERATRRVQKKPEKTLPDYNKIFTEF